MAAKTYIFGEVRAHPRRLTNLEASLHTADPGTAADRRDTAAAPKKRITLPYWRHDRRRHWRNHRRADLSGGAGASTAASAGSSQAAVAQFKNELPPAPSEVISSGAGAIGGLLFLVTLG